MPFYKQRGPHLLSQVHPLSNLYAHTPPRAREGYSADTAAMKQLHTQQPLNFYPVYAIHKHRYPGSRDYSAVHQARVWRIEEPPVAFHYFQQENTLNRLE